jgi:hypothetical protein
MLVDCLLTEVKNCLLETFVHVFGHLHVGRLGWLAYADWLLVNQVHQFVCKEDGIRVVLSFDVGMNCTPQTAEQ